MSVNLYTLQVVYFVLCLIKVPSVTITVSVTILTVTDIRLLQNCHHVVVVIRVFP